MKRVSPGNSASSFSISRATRWSNLLVLTLVLMLAIGGCASQQSAAETSQDLVALMPIELRQRADAVVLRVVANSEFQLDLGDTLEGSSSEERTTAGADAVKRGAGTIMTTGCDPRMLYVWIISCPGGILVGAGVALTGSIGSAVYGHTTAWSRDDINAAKAALGRAQLQTNLANELRDRLISTLQDTTSTRIIQNETAATATGQPTNDNTSTIVLAVDIEDFFVSEVGEASPDLWVDFEVSAGLYEFPDTRPLYKRRWLLYTELGDYHDLISAGGLGLRTKLNAAFDKMALAIANDLFMTEKSTASGVDDELNGEVVTTYTSVPSVSGVELPDREEMLSSYLLYLAERDVAYPESLNTQGITGTNTEPSQPTAGEFSATLGALKLSFERGEVSDEEFMQKQRAVVNEYTRATRAGLGIEASSPSGKSSGKHLRVALLPFARLSTGMYPRETLYDFVHAYVDTHKDMELVFSEHDAVFQPGLAGTEAEVWKGTFTQKFPNKRRIIRGAERVYADVAVLFSHKKRTAGWYGNEFNFSVYVVDIETTRTYTMQGTELNYKKVIEEALTRVLRARPQSLPPLASEAVGSAKTDSVLVGILSPGFNRPTSPTNNDLEEQFHGEVRRFFRANPSFTVSYDYTTTGGVGPSGAHSVWQGTVVRKEPNKEKMQIIGKELGVDCVVLAWIKNDWATSTADLYVLDVGKNRIHQRTVEIGKARAQIEATISMCKTPT